MKLELLSDTRGWLAGVLHMVESATSLKSAGWQVRMKRGASCMGNGRKRALAADLTHQEATKKTQNNALSIILFLMETKLTVREMEPIKAKLGFQSMLAMSSEGR